MEKSQQNKKKYPNPAPKPDKKKEKVEKEKKETKKATKVAPPPKPAPPPVQSAEVPFFQNELVKPLVYVVALVSLLSFLYLIMS